MEFFIFCAGVIVTLIVAFGILVSCVFVGNKRDP